jgi:predicted nucleic acid-binding protein
VEIVADSSPLISCARAGKLKLIRDVYRKIIIPPSVYAEVVTGGAGRPGADEIEAAVSLWVEMKEPQDRDFVHRLEQRLGPGESEALALAKELDAYLLADERKVIDEARDCGIRVKSTLLTLIEAKERDLIVSVRTELDELMASGFRCSDALYRKALALSREF